VFVSGAKLFPDYFVEGAEEFFMQHDGELKKASKESRKQSPSSAGGVDDLFTQITALLNEEMTQKVGAVYRFELKGGEPGNWVVDLKNGAGMFIVPSF